MGLRDKLKRLEHAARGNMSSFQLLDGSHYYFDPTSAELFLHWVSCAETSAHNWPEPPEPLRKLTEARDVAAALEMVGGKTSFDIFPCDREVLISERRLEPRGLVSRYDPGTGEHRVLDPYDSEPEDLSEP